MSPVGIHPSGEPPSKRVHQRFKDMQKWALWHYNVHGAQGPLQAFTAMFQYGLFERFPKIKIVVLESGAGWAGYLLNRMDAVFDSPLGDTVNLKEKPSYYFYRNCWISGDPDEKAFGHVVDFRRRRQILLGLGLSASRPSGQLYGRVGRTG